MARVRGPTLLMLLLTMLAWSAPPKPAGPATPAPGVDSDQCTRAAAGRARLAALLAQGRIRRALRVIRRANELCPSARAKSWAMEVRLLAALGRWTDVRTVASSILAADHSAVARAAAREALARAARHGATTGMNPVKGAATFTRAERELEQGDTESALSDFLEAWEEWRPNGRALVQAGHAAQLLGRSTQAQRLFDRGVAELEAMTEAKARMEVAGLLHGRAAGVAWQGTRLAVAHGDVVSLLDEGSLREVLRLQHPHRSHVRWSVAFSPDGSMLAAAAGGETVVRLWDATTGRQLRELQEPGTWGMVFSADGETLVTMTTDKTIRRWSATTGRQIGNGRKLQALQDVADAVALSPDGKLLAVGALDAIELWDLAGDKHLSTYRHRGPGLPRGPLPHHRTSGSASGGSES